MSEFDSVSLKEVEDLNPLRHELIEKKFLGKISPREKAQLIQLQRMSAEVINREFPLPPLPKLSDHNEELLKEMEKEKNMKVKELKSILNLAKDDDDVLVVSEYGVPVHVVDKELQPEQKCINLFVMGPNDEPVRIELESCESTASVESQAAAQRVVGGKLDV